MSGSPIAWPSAGAAGAGLGCYQVLVKVGCILCGTCHYPVGCFVSSSLWDAMMHALFSEFRLWGSVAAFALRTSVGPSGSGPASLVRSFSLLLCVLGAASNLQVGCLCWFTFSCTFWPVMLLPRVSVDLWSLLSCCPGCLARWGLCVCCRMPWTLSVQ